ncbi:hypothetical protein GBF38_010175 [Nibea albiflora]|uniref:Uncharacterized protein n=1 Tax=Nibea albiflora TaxID=240163 RepID=A0ACB7F8P9_NIBAL|nr:hypothetical protein GBF38_010175 [Nibea albiflora]
MKDSFRGHYPDGQLEPCGDRVSTDCRVTNCGVGEQAISMQRRFPPDRWVQGPDLVTQPDFHSSGFVHSQRCLPQEEAAAEDVWSVRDSVKEVLDILDLSDRPELKHGLSCGSPVVPLPSFLVLPQSSVIHRVS